MIDRQEVLEFAREVGIDPNIVEKDYILGWVLAGIADHHELKNNWIFKGGTCLKKCFFETFRFSEDLDFTIINASHLDQEFLIKSFTEIAQWIYEKTGIEIIVDGLRFDVYENPRGNVSVEGRLYYRGPMQRGGTPPRVKLDLTNDEILSLKPHVRKIHHPYSDEPENGISILCYCFEEVFAEKLRALTERLRPRDLYDVIHLYRHNTKGTDRTTLVKTLEEKCKFKGIVVPSLEILESKPERMELETEWEHMLAHQLPELPPFVDFWKELPEVFDWLLGVIEKIKPETIPISREVDSTWKPPPMVSTWHLKAPLEIIRFAAANQLCVELEYQGLHRLIEPYSLRRTKDGNILLLAIRHDTGDTRSYRIDRIEGAKASKISFVPKYEVELTSSEPISIPPTSRKSRDFDGLEPTYKKRRERLKSKQVSTGLKYIIECSYCGKKFRRNKFETRINPHKNKQGYQCPGRNGFLVETK